MSIYVETLVHSNLEDLWQRTQDPALHEQWDLRFSEINYLPRDSDEPQRSRYMTRLGFGLSVRGEGESTGTRAGAAGERTSALRFWSPILSRSSAKVAGTGGTSRPLTESAS